MSFGSRLANSWDEWCYSHSEFYWKICIHSLFAHFSQLYTHFEFTSSTLAYQCAVTTTINVVVVLYCNATRRTTKTSILLFEEKKVNPELSSVLCWDWTTERHILANIKPVLSLKRIQKSASDACCITSSNWTEYIWQYMV